MVGDDNKISKLEIGTYHIPEPFDGVCTDRNNICTGKSETVDILNCFRELKL